MLLLFVQPYVTMTDMDKIIPVVNKCEQVLEKYPKDFAMPDFAYGESAMAKGDPGKGEYVDIGMLDSQVAILANQAMNYLISGNVPKRQGNAHPNIQPQDVFACIDGDIAIAVGNDLQFSKLCQVLESPEFITDQRFDTIQNRNRNVDALRRHIADKLSQNNRQYWVEKLDAAGVPASPINSLAEIFEDDQVKAREMIKHIQHPLAGTMPIVASPMRFRETPTKQDCPPPLLSEHSIEILRELDMEEDEIERLHEKGII